MRPLIIVVLFLIALPVHSAWQWTPATEQHAATLADTTQWRALLHYYPRTFGRGWHSQVDDPDFFLAPAGLYDPVAELRATIDAFYLPATAADQHAICRFPARWRWLSQQLSLPPRHTRSGTMPGTDRVARHYQTPQR